MEENRQYRYFAFISYSRRDERWAKWLQTRLETYHLPAAVRKQHADTPRRIAPVFRDKTDLSGGVLQEQLHNELDDSRFLILICSPNSAASEWVDREVRRFVESGRAEQIIPFVVDGAADQSVFPPSLRWGEEKSLLGISVQEMGRTAAFLRVVSTMLGLKYDELARRHRKRMVRRCAAAAVATVLALAAAGRAWWYYTPHSAYYANYVTRYEIPEGVNELSAKERQGLSEYYRIVTRKGKLVLLERVNAAGDLVEPAVPEPGLVYPRMAFIYNDAGELSRMEIYDAKEKMIQQRIFSYDLGNQIAVDLLLPGESLRAATMPDDATSGSLESISDGRSDIIRLLNEYDRNGFLINSLFQRDSLNTRTCDANGVYGVRYEHDAQGLVISALNLNDVGRAHSTRYGVAEKRYEYDGQGRVVLASTYDEEGELVLSQKGCAQLAVERDGKGNAVSLRCLDEEGLLCNTLDKYARAEVTYDGQGQRIGVRLYDAAGEPAYDTHGVHETRYTYDDEGRLASASYFDGGGEPLYCREGYFCARYTYDGEGRDSGFLTYDAQGQLCGGYHGMAGYRRTYDEDEFDSTTSVTTIGLDGEPAPCAEGYYTLRYDENEYGRPYLEEYLDVNGELTEDIYGVATNRYAYDMQGSLSIREYFDSWGDRCYKDGDCSVWYEFENGRCVLMRLFGTEREPISPGGWCELHVDYDEWGDVVCYQYYDEQGEPVQDGRARLEYTVDSHGNLLEKRSYDVSGQPFQIYDDGEDCWKKEMEYDRWGNCVKEMWVSLTGQYRRGYAGYLREYDERHNLVTLTCVDEAGEPCGDEFGTCKLFNTYDERNRLIRQEYLNISGERGTDTGTTAVERQYDERGRLDRDVYMCSDGAGGERVDYQIVYIYDEYGQITDSQLLDAGGAALQG